MKIIFSKIIIIFWAECRDRTHTSNWNVRILPSELIPRNCTASGTWTHTAITGQRILSPSCLPIPPWRRYNYQSYQRSHQYKYNKCFCIYIVFVGIGGLEPSCDQLRFRQCIRLSRYIPILIAFRKFSSNLLNFPSFRRIFYKAFERFI